MDHIINTFIKLVRIDSPSGHEQLMARHLAGWLKKLDFSVREDRAGNIIAQRAGDGNLLLLSAHMDTVEPGRGIKPIIKNGKIISAGDTILGADNKAAIAAIIYAVEKYLRNKKYPRAIEIVFTANEESGTGGSELLDISRLKSKLGIIFDSSEPIGAISLASPYICNFQVIFIGKAAHVKNLEQGKNALEPAISFMANMKIGRLDKGMTSVNIGKISGGSGLNVVPEKISILGEVRGFSKKLFDKQLRSLEAKARACGKKSGTKVSFVQDGYFEGYLFRNNDEDVIKVSKVLADEGYKVRYTKTFSASDANILNAKGMKTLNLSYGAEKVHSKEEFITVKNLKRLGEIVHSCLEKLE